MKEYEKWIVIPDLQLPYIDDKTLLAVERYMMDVSRSDHPWDGWLQLGDFLDFNELSTHNEGKPGLIKEDAYDSFQAGNRFLDRHQAIVLMGNVNARFVLLEGNHDYRSKDYAFRFPQLERILDYRRNLELDKRHIEWVECWEDKSKMFSLGNAHFVHGNFTNQYHAAKMVMRYGVCIYYGHTHDVMEFPLARLGDNKSLIGKSLGCLCDYKQRYLRGNPTNWVQAFAEFHVFPNGFYSEHTIRIYDHTFTGLNGKIYNGNNLYYQ